MRFRDPQADLIVLKIIVMATAASRIAGPPALPAGQDRTVGRFLATADLWRLFRELR
jgi:hypothetical protein